MKVYSHIYQLSDNSGCRYVGQTISPLTKRRNDHVSSAVRGESTYKASWIRSVLESGGDIYISSIECGEWTQEERDAREVYWIAELRAQGARLTNTTAGGFGHIPNKAERAYISYKTKEAMANPEVRAKMKKLQPVECKTCGTIFEPRRARDKTCSFDCGQALATSTRIGRSRVDKNVVCAVCGVIFTRVKPRQITCSTSCAGVWRGEKTAKPYPDGVCINCGQSYRRTRANRARKTCSESCRYRVVAEKRNNNG